MNSDADRQGRFLGGGHFISAGRNAHLKPSEKLPTLPSTQVADIGDDPPRHLVQPLVLLTEGLMSGAGLT